MTVRLIRNALRTPDGTVLQSFSRHDYKTYTDANGKQYMIDGGLDYVRSSANGDEVYLTMYDNEPHAVQAKTLKWGTYGKDGKGPLTFIAIDDMSSEHIEAVLTRFSPSEVIRECMRKELVRRSQNDPSRHKGDAYMGEVK